MTGLLHEKSFSRKSFVKGGGALIIGFSLLGSAGRAKAATTLNPYLSPVLNQSEIDTWITVHADNRVSIKSGAIRQGTGSDTGILQIAAEELDMDMSQMEFVRDDTAVTPSTGQKSASNTICGGAGRGVRAAAASAKQVLLGLAATRLGVPASQLTVSKGVVSGGGKTVTYGDLLGGKLFNVTMPAKWNMQNLAGGIGWGREGPPGYGWNGAALLPGQAPAKPVSQYTMVGTSQPRIDIPAIVTGSEPYIQNVVVPGMLHGRVVRPRGQAVYGFGAPIESVDESSIAHIPGARVVRVHNFLGVVAPQEYDAIQAAAQLKVKWAEPPAVLPGGGDIYEHMRRVAGAAQSTNLAGNTDLPTGALSTSGDVETALGSAAHVVADTYGWPQQVHTPIGAQCAVADVTPEGVRIFSGCQDSYNVQTPVAAALKLPLEKVRVSAYTMGGCFGDGCQYRDTAIAAAVLSRAVGKPVRVQLMRWDEIGWDYSSPGTMFDIRAGIDAKGNVVAFDTTQYYPYYESEALELTAQLMGFPLQASTPQGNYWPFEMYKVANNQYQVKAFPLEGKWINSDWMRAGSSPHATFAGEQVIDELAHAAKMDPVAFRRQNVTSSDARGMLLEVMDAVTEAANWTPRVSASNLSNANVVSGRGFAWSNVYIDQAPMATVADVEVNKKTGKVSVTHIYQAFIAGLLVNPGLVENQQIGGITQLVSRLMTEQLLFSRTHVVSSDFVSYPILRFQDAPKITAITLQQKDAYPQGVGETVTVATPAAIANAIFDATGVRIRTTPYTPARVRYALKAAGVA